jgi:hypothetical protein
MNFKDANPSKEEWDDCKKYYFHKPAIIEAVQVRHGFTVETLEGVLGGKPFDYLVKGTHGEFYPVDKTIFEEIYDEVICEN